MVNTEQQGGRTRPTRVQRVMVVDDDESVREYVGRLLRESDYEVAVSPSAEDALRELESSPCDLVLLDLKLPGMQGIEALRTIKERWPETDVIILTGYASVESAVHSMKAGAADYITKPFSAGHITVVVEKTLYRRELEVKARERDLFERLSRVDAMTDVYNHRFFQETLRSEIGRANRYGQVLSLLMADVDDFKRYNDVNGHQAGDDALRKLAGILKAEARGSDYVARYGGEEFAVVLGQTGKTGAAVYANRVLAVVRQAALENEGAQPGGRLSVSMGLASYPQHATSKEGLIRMADNALYRAKRLGKNRLCVCERALDGEPPKPPNS